MEHKCKNLIFAALAVLLISGTAMGIINGNATTPVALIVNINVQLLDTAFTVTPVSPETQMNFSALQNTPVVQPDGQTDIAPWATIANGGNVAQNFTASIDEATIPVDIANNSAFTGAVTLTAAAQSPTGWTNVAAATTVNLFAQANFTGATVGVSTKTVYINSSQVS